MWTDEEMVSMIRKIERNILWNMDTTDEEEDIMEHSRQELYKILHARNHSEGRANPTFLL